MTEKALFETLTSGNLANQFGTFNSFQIREAKKILRENSSILRFAQILLEDYPFDQLRLTDGSKRDEFAFAMAQCWLFTRTNLQTPMTFSFYNCFASPLSVVINLEYELLIDEVEIIERLTREKIGDLVIPKPSKRPIDYEKRFSHWGFLEKLKNASICELKALILVSNAMSAQNQLLEFSRISNDKIVLDGIRYLSDDGLLVLDAPKENLLALFPVKVLKSFAIEHGVKKIPSRKDALINVIKETCNLSEIFSFVDFLLNDPQYSHGYAQEKFMQPTIPNAKIFQEYVRNELNRLALYLESISCIEYDYHTVVSPIVKQNKPGKRPGDPYQNSMPFGYNNNKRAFRFEDAIERVLSFDLRTIQKYWDAHCDTLLAKARDENPNIFPVSQLVSFVMSYWDKSNVLDNYKSETRHTTRERHWHWLLNCYATYLLGQDEKYQLKSSKHTCNGCGQVFKEWSIPLDFALRVNKNIEFCSSCYHFIFNHRYMANTTKAFRIPKQTILEYLFELSKALEFIPTRSYMENIELPSQSPKRQIDVGRLLLKMPAYEIYIEKFSVWLKALSLAGVLDNGYQKTSRGIQCLANDGHLCLSLGEKAVDDWLSEHNIAHEKETFYPFDEKLNPNELSRTDWKIGNIFIEYAGMMSDEEYANKMKRKIQLARKNNLILIVIEPNDLFHLDDKLKSLI